MPDTHRLMTPDMVRAAFEACNCKFIGMDSSDPWKYIIQVKWAQDPSLQTVVLELIDADPHIPQMDIYQVGYDDFPVDMSERANSFRGCYVPEVVGYICRIWATG